MLGGMDSLAGRDGHLKVRRLDGLGLRERKDTSSVQLPSVDRSF